MILKLPGGYDFEVSAGGAALSGGQRQRIALARAFYGAPVLVVMDEPDSNLDAEGTMALARAVEGHKKRGGAAVIVAHRHGAFAQCDTVYVMEAGRPVPATADRRKAPVRQLQSGARVAAETAPPTERQPGSGGGARTATNVRAAGGESPLPGARVARFPTGEPAQPARPAIPGRERQIADAIARVTGARFRSGRADEEHAGAAPGGGDLVSTDRNPRNDAS